MKNKKFKTKLSKAQKLKNILVFTTVYIFSYIFSILFSFAINIVNDMSIQEILLLNFAMSFGILSMLLFPIMIIALILGMQKGKAKRVREDSSFVPVQNIDYYRDDLRDLNPALVSILVDLDIYSKNDIVATMLRLQKKKVVSFKENGKIDITIKNDDELENSEIELLNLVQNGKLNIKKVLSAWKKNRFYEAEKLGYIKQKDGTGSHTFSKRTMALLFAFFIFSILLWGMFLSLNIYSEGRTIAGLIKIFLFLIAMDTFMFVPIYFLGREAMYVKRGDVLWERTALGNETAEKIYGLKNFINEFSLLSKAKQEQLVLWEDYLIYAIVLEENEKIVKDICKSLQVNFDYVK